MTGATEEKTMQAVAKEIGKSADSLRAAIQISDSLKNAKTKLLLQVMEEFKRQMAPLKETYHLEEETQKKLEKIKEKSQQEVEKVLDRERKKNQTAIDALKQEYEENHEIYAEEIVRHMIEV